MTNKTQTLLDKPFEEWTEEDKQIMLSVLQRGVEVRETYL